MASLSQLKTPKSILSQTIDEAFPAVDPGCVPFGSRVLVQIKSAARKTAAGIILTDDTVETEHDNTKIAKVIAVGPGAFKNRETLEPWPEGAWCKPGDYVRLPLYDGHRWRVPVAGTELFAHFAMIEDLNIQGAIVGDPLRQLAWIGS